MRSGAQVSTFDDLRHILLAGGGLNISAAGYTEEQLRFLAMAAAGSGKMPMLILRDTDHLSSEQLRFIGMAGAGCVVFSDQ
jgi:hypothetical protein